MSTLEVDVLGELGSALKYLFESLQLVLEVSTRWPQTGVLFLRVCGLDSFAGCLSSSNLMFFHRSDIRQH